MVYVHNISGKTLKHFNTRENEILIDTKGFPRGVYLIRVQNRTGNSTKKLVIQ